MVEQNSNMDFGRDPATEGESEGIDFEAVKDKVGFALRAGRRRPKLAVMTFLVVAALGVAVATALPKAYSAEVKILAQRTSAIRALSGQNQAMNYLDDPTKNVANMIIRRDNLLALVREANLTDRFGEERPRLLRLKDRLSTWLRGPLSEEDKLYMMVGTLEKKLEVTTDDNTMVISVDWPSAQMAYDLVTLVQKNFLEARYDSDLSLITDSLAVLQEHAKTEQGRLETALREYQEVMAPADELAPTRNWTSRLAGDNGPRRERAGSGDVAPNLELDETRLKIRALEQERQRLTDSVQQQLAEAQLSLTPMHPTVVALQQRLDTMRAPSQELIKLKNDERELTQEAAQAAAAASASASAAQTPRLLHVGEENAPPVQVPRRRSTVEDAPTRVARSKFESAIQSYEAAMARIDAANIELDITRTSYKYRYTVITPAELPLAPKKPMGRIVGIASIVGAALLAFLVAALADILGGRILEPWQVRRTLKLEVLGELDRPG